MNINQILRHIAACRRSPGHRLLDVIYGPQAKTLRAQVAAMLLDRKVTGSDKAAQFGNLRRALLDATGVTGTCIAVEDANFEDKANQLIEDRGQDDMTDAEIESATNAGYDKLARGWC